MKINTLSGGYKGGSPRIRSENPLPTPEGGIPRKIDSQDLINKIKDWYFTGGFNIEDIRFIIEELKKL